MNDVIKAAAKHLRNTCKANLNENVGSSHAHNAIAGFLGFNSKKALKADYDNTPIEDPHIIFKERFSPDIDKLSKNISAMKDSPLQKLPIQTVADIIKESLTPECEACGRRVVDSFPVHTEENDGYYEFDGHVCSRCADDEDYYATCKYCGPDIKYRADEINSSGECHIHSGESDMTDQEREDWDSYIENINKDF